MHKMIPLFMGYNAIQVRLVEIVRRLSLVLVPSCLSTPVLAMRAASVPVVPLHWPPAQAQVLPQLVAKVLK